MLNEGSLPRVWKLESPQIASGVLVGTFDQSQLLI